LREAQQQLVDSAHKSGMAEIVVGVLHNIGNILNSVNISSEEIIRTVQKSKIEGLIMANEMLGEHVGDIGDFIANDSKGKLLPEYYIKIGGILKGEHAKLEDEAGQLLKEVTIIKNVIETQQEYARGEYFNEKINLPDIIEDAVTLQRDDFHARGIKVIRDYSDKEEIMIKAQKSKLIHIFINLLKNAGEAMGDIAPDERTLTIKIDHDESSVRIRILDSGEGIAEENLEKIFNFGFSTKKGSHGFGLHTCANFITEMGGRIFAESEGHGKGASFTLIFPANSVNSIRSTYN